MSLSEKKLFVFDMDGTIYLGNNVFPFAIDFIKNLRKNGKKVLFFTNNASRSADTYVERLTKMGFEPTRKEILTSGDVTEEFLLRHRNGKSIYLVGTPDLISEFQKKKLPLVDGNTQADIVITSFDTTLTYEKLDNACRMIRNGAEYFSTHPDFNCPTENGFIPDSGAISAFVTASTGKVPTYFGKPYKETVEMICEVTGMQKNEILFIGDRLYTDIAVGKNNGVEALLVMTGETTKEDLAICEKKSYPDYVYPSLKEVDKELFG